MPYAGVVLRRQKKYIEIFQSVGAVDREHAISLEEYKIKRDSIFEKMLFIRLFEECENGRFYLNTDIALKLLKNRSGFHLWRINKE